MSLYLYISRYSIIQFFINYFLFMLLILFLVIKTAINRTHSAFLILYILYLLNLIAKIFYIKYAIKNANKNEIKLLSNFHK